MLRPQSMGERAGHKAGKYVTKGPKPCKRVKKKRGFFPRNLPPLGPFRSGVKARKPLKNLAKKATRQSGGFRLLKKACFYTSV